MNTTALSAANAADRIEIATRQSHDAASPSLAQRLAAPSLRAAAASWFVVMVIGQMFFAVYLVLFYGRAAVQGHPETWNKVLQAGYVSGATASNAVLISHLVFALLITLGGALQLLPVVRRRWPRLHRWNGRVYLVGAAIGSLSGLIMIWTRDTGGDLSQHIAISINALLILGFAGMALKHALARRFDLHRPWALRLFLAVSGGWFFRVGLMLWVVLNHGPAGFDPKTFTGPFLTFLSFAQYLLPLGVLQLYLLAQDTRAARRQLAMAAGLFTLTLAMAGGIFFASLALWLPHMR